MDRDEQRDIRCARPNEGTITLEKKPWTAPAEVLVPGEDEKALIHHGGERLEWQVVG